MALKASTSPAFPASLELESENAELSEDQIQKLLEEAKYRLRTASRNKEQAMTTERDTSEEDGKKRYAPLPKLNYQLEVRPYIQEKNGIAKVNSALLVGQEQRKLAEKLLPAGESQRSKKMNDQLSAGPKWFDLPKTDLTPQLKRDLQVIELRSVLDPHRHYKKDDRKGKIPTFSQVGTVVEGPTEWFSSRINKKDRSKNFVEETMNIERETGRFKRKYDEIQTAKTSGKKAHYKNLMAKRKKRS